MPLAPTIPDKNAPLPTKYPLAVVTFPLTFNVNSCPTLVMFGCAGVNNVPSKYVAPILPLVIVPPAVILPATARFPKSTFPCVRLLKLLLTLMKAFRKLSPVPSFGDPPTLIT